MMSSIAQLVFMAWALLLAAAYGSTQHQHDHRVADISSLGRQQKSGSVVRKAISQDAYPLAKEAVDHRVCVLVSVNDPIALIRHGLHHFTETLKVPSRSLNYIVHDTNTYRANPAKSRVVSVLHDSGLSDDNIFEYFKEYNAKNQREMFQNCSETSFQRRPSQGAPWVSWIDSDEFPVMPKRGQTFSEHIGELVQNGLNLSAGFLVDRVAENGSLARRISDDEDIFSQFPKTCSLTGKIMMGYNTKALAFAYGCILDANCYPSPLGSHHLSMFHTLSCQPRSVWAQVAHFKWNADAQAKLTERVKFFGSNSDEGFWGAESKHLLQYLMGHRGFVDIESECFVLPTPESHPPITLDRGMAPPEEVLCDASH